MRFLAKRSAGAPIRGVRAGQTLPPRKIAPRGQITTRTQRWPISIVPASHKRSADPPAVLLSDSDTQEVISRTQSPRKSPRSMSTLQRTPRVNSASFQGPSSSTSNAFNPIVPVFDFGFAHGRLQPVEQLGGHFVCYRHELQLSDLGTPFRWSQTPQRRLQLKLRQKSQNQVLLLQGALATPNHKSQRCRRC